MPTRNILTSRYLGELESEAAASRKCLERIPENLFDWSPHEKSMKLGYLALLVAEIPKWIKDIVETGEIDFATYPHYQPKTTGELVRHFDDNMADARRTLGGMKDESLPDKFELKANGKILISTSKDVIIGSSINHMVHHRGQLSVYMRMNGIPVPQIYGPSADEGWG